MCFAITIKISFVQKIRQLATASLLFHCQTFIIHLKFLAIKKTFCIRPSLTSRFVFLFVELMQYQSLYYKFGDIGLPKNLAVEHYICTKCGNKYSSKKSLRRHLNYECGVEPKFKCPYCDAPSKQKAHVKEHIRRRHKNQRIYVIDLSLNQCT